MITRVVVEDCRVFCLLEDGSVVLFNADYPLKPGRKLTAAAERLIEKGYGIETPLHVQPDATEAELLAAIHEAALEEELSPRPAA